VFALGKRNPIGLAPAPDADVLWTVVSASVQDGAFYGWPYSYSGKNLEKPVKPHRLDLVEKPIAPHCAIGAHEVDLAF
jgi:glucose/arabinose dehydrogenase